MKSKTSHLEDSVLYAFQAMTPVIGQAYAWRHTAHERPLIRAGKVAAMTTMQIAAYFPTVLYALNKF